MEKNGLPGVCIVLINYNGGRITRECLESLEEISYPNYQIVIVDNHSEDDSLELLKEYESDQIKLLRMDDNLGFTGGNNRGIEYALRSDASYVLLLNNDTVVAKDFLEPLVQAFDDFPGCGLSVGKIFYERERDKVWYGGGNLNHRTARTDHYIDGRLEKRFQNHPAEISFATGCCFCLSCETIRKVGPLDDDYFIYSDDVDYCYRVNRAGLKIIYVPQSVIYHKISSTFGELSMTSQRLTVRNTYLFIKKNLTGFSKIPAYVYMSVLFLYKVHLGLMRLSYVIQGIWDFVRGKRGKPEWIKA